MGTNNIGDKRGQADENHRPKQTVRNGKWTGRDSCSDNDFSLDLNLLENGVWWEPGPVEHLLMEVGEI